MIFRHFLNKKGLWIAWLAVIMMAFAIPVNAATYTYDDLGRLTSVTTASGPSSTYTYDAGGNILSVVSQGSPAMISSDPQNLAANVPVDKTIQVRFNKNIEQGTNFSEISLTTGQDTISITNTVTDEILSVDPVKNLVESTSYTLHIPAGAIKFVSGIQSNTEITVQFTTAAPGLNMVSSDPVNNATGVPMEQTITVTFSQDVQAGDNYNNISLTAGGLPVSTSNSISGSVLTVDPTADLVGTTEHILTLPAGALNEASRSASNSEITLQFTTVGSNLSMLSSDPINNATGVPMEQTITVTFSQNVQAGDNYNNISLTAGGLPVSTSNSISGSVLTVDPTADLAGTTEHILTIPAGALKNMDNSALNSQITTQFTTG